MRTLLSKLSTCGPVPGLSAGVDDAEEQHQRERHGGAHSEVRLRPAVRSTRGTSSDLADSAGRERSGTAVRHEEE